MNSDNANKIKAYLGLPEDELESMNKDPFTFLSQNLKYLPPELATFFSPIVTPKSRTTIPLIRNRRLRYTQSGPKELSWAKAKNHWPLLWEGRGPLGRDEGEEERMWADKEFLGGAMKPLVGHLGVLLADYEEAREAERVRTLRREKAAAEAALPEEDEDTDDDDDEEPQAAIEEDNSTDEEVKQAFERVIRERFIYGLLEGAEYDTVDWDDKWDSQMIAEEEDRWFDDEEES